MEQTYKFHFNLLWSCAMKVNNRIQNLQQKHNNLQKNLNTEFLHFQDDTKIKELKKQKLRLKDEIAWLHKIYQTQQ